MKNKNANAKANPFLVMLTKLIGYRSIAFLGRLRTPFFLASKRIQSNLEFNEKKELSFPISGQDLEPVKDMRIGRGSFGKNGCGVLAVCNLLSLLGKEPAILKVAGYMERKGVVWDGKLGVSPLAVKKCLRIWGVDTKAYTRSKNWDSCLMTKQYGILCYWWVSKNAMGAHYVTVKKGENGVEIYNLYGKDRRVYRYADLKSFLHSGGYKKVIVLFSVTEVKK